MLPRRIQLMNVGNINGIYNQVTSWNMRGNQIIPPLIKNIKLATYLIHSAGGGRSNRLSPGECMKSLVIEPAMCGNATINPKRKLLKLRYVLKGNKIKIMVAVNIALKGDDNLKNITENPNTAATRKRLN